MKVIGLTGGIASGKSTVALLLRDICKLPIIDADKLSRDAVKPGSKGMCMIKETFGEGVIYSDGNLNRPAMGKMICTDAKIREQLDQILHPIIGELYQNELKKYCDAGEKLVIYDCPLLIESGHYKDVDEIVLVVTDPEERLKRIMERDGVDKSFAERKIAIQMPDEEKMKYADKIIYNNGNIEDLKAVLDMYISKQ